jgi:hypothetical protein
MATGTERSETAGLPPGYRILNDGPGREVLFREEWDEGDVCSTVEEAVERARWLEGLA